MLREADRKTRLTGKQVENGDNLSDLLWEAEGTRITLQEIVIVSRSSPSCDTQLPFLFHQLLFRSEAQTHNFSELRSLFSSTFYFLENLSTRADSNFLVLFSNKCLLFL